MLTAKYGTTIMRLQTLLHIIIKSRISPKKLTGTLANCIKFKVNIQIKKPKKEYKNKLIKKDDLPVVGQIFPGWVGNSLKNQAILHKVSALIELLIINL